VIEVEAESDGRGCCSRQPEANAVAERWGSGTRFRGRRRNLALGPQQRGETGIDRSDHHDERQRGSGGDVVIAEANGHHWNAQVQHDEAERGGAPGEDDGADGEEAEGHDGEPGHGGQG
jgi:hypothetical protein